MSGTTCEVCFLDSAVDSVMWTCVGCTRKFHAACVGVAVPRGSLRNSKKAVPTSFLLPCCSTCQTLVTASFDFKGLVVQQERLQDQINASTEVVHSLKLQMEKPTVVKESMDAMEILLTTVKNELASINKTNSLAGCVNSIKSHISYLSDFAIKEINKNMNTTTSELASNMRDIHSEFSRLKEVSIDTVANCSGDMSSSLAAYIVGELKSLKANIKDLKKTTTMDGTAGSNDVIVDSNLQNTTPIVIADQVAVSSPSSHSRQNLTQNRTSIVSLSPGEWRTLGARMIWRADWSEYDARKLRRMNQQKEAAKAKKQRQQRERNHFLNNISNTCSTNFRTQNLAHTSNTMHHSAMQRNQIRSHDYDNSNQLPTDRELLACAKERFSRPGVGYRPINFLRGETLNPYPAAPTPAVPMSPVPAHLSNLMIPGSSTMGRCTCGNSGFAQN